VSGACLYRCPICYARAYPWSQVERIVIYENLTEKLKQELDKAKIIFPIYLSQVTDPLQPYQEIRTKTEKIVQLLLSYELSFGIVTKSADGPLWLLKRVPELIGYPYWFLTITVESVPAKQVVTSPFASPILDRLKTIRYFNQLGIKAICRIDPVLLGLLNERDVLWLVKQGSCAGSNHIIASTGYFNKVSMMRVIEAFKQSAYKKNLPSFLKFYRVNLSKIDSVDERKRFMVSLPIRKEFHTWLRQEVEALGMTYAVCQELPKEFDSKNIPSCEGAENIFVHIKDPNGKFKPINCHGDCLRNCPNPDSPPCGEKRFLTTYPYHPKLLYTPESQLSLNWN
jgi:DNA repair photolyase